MFEKKTSRQRSKATAPQADARTTTTEQTDAIGDVPAFYARRKKRSNELCQILIRSGGVKPEHVRKALAIQEERGGQIGRILVKMGACSERAIAQALAEQVRLSHEVGGDESLSDLARKNPAIAGLSVACSPALTTTAILASDLFVFATVGLLATACDYLVAGELSPALLKFGFAPFVLCLLVLAVQGSYAAAAPSPVEEIRRTTIALNLVFLCDAVIAIIDGEWSELLFHGHMVMFFEWALSVFLIPIMRGVVRGKFASKAWWGVPVVVLGAGVTGRRLVHSLRMLPTTGLRPVLILDDDTRKHGTLRASLNDAEEINVNSVRDVAVHSVQRVEPFSMRDGSLAQALEGARGSSRDLNRSGATSSRDVHRAAGASARDVNQPPPGTTRDPQPPAAPESSPSTLRQPSSWPPSPDGPISSWPPSPDSPSRESMFQAAPKSPLTSTSVAGPLPAPPDTLSRLPHSATAVSPASVPSSRKKKPDQEPSWMMEMPESIRGLVRGQFAEVEGVPVIGGLELAPLLAKRLGISYAILAMPGQNSRKLLGVMERVGGAFSHLLVIPDLIGLASIGVPARDVGGVVGIEVRQQLLLPGPRFAKRLMDVALTSVGGLLIMPIIALLVLLIKLDSKGAAFYTQKRMGRDGKKFIAYKFRSMHGDGEARLKAVLEADPKLRAEYDEFHKLSFDPRVTRIGKIIRKYSLDELPQLWNVFTGDMSLVGPRPYLEREVPEMGQKEGIILRAMPGLTGLWQVSDRNATGFAERLKMDVHYVRNWSPWLDIYVLARTVGVVLRGTGS